MEISTRDNRDRTRSQGHRRHPTLRKQPLGMGKTNGILHVRISEWVGVVGHSWSLRPAAIPTRPTAKRRAVEGSGMTVP